MNVRESEEYIRQAAIARGIDPEEALRVARAEGLQEGVHQSNVYRNGVREPSYGDFQLLVGGGSTGFPAGLGNEFIAKTGLDPADPANEQATIDFALDTAAREGWGKWYGARKAGVGTGPTSALSALVAPPATSAGLQPFRPAFGDLVAANEVGTTPVGNDLPSLGLGFLEQAEKRRAQEAEDTRQRRAALFAQPVAPMPSAGLSGLYG